MARPATGLTQDPAVVLFTDGETMHIISRYCLRWLVLPNIKNDHNKHEICTSLYTYSNNLNQNAHY